MLTGRSNPNDTPTVYDFTITIHQTLQYLEGSLTAEEKKMIEDSVINPALREVMRSIADYQKTAVRTSITKKVVDQFLKNGITQFGSTIETFRIRVLEYLDHYVELRDEDPQRCLMKVLYQCIQCKIHNVNPG